MLWKFTADQVLFFDWIVGSCQANLLKQGRVVWKAVDPGLKVNRFHCFCIVLKLKTERQYTENLTTKLQNSNQNSTLSWVSLIGL